MKKPVLLYTLASNGMAHATRAVPMLERLQKDYEIHVFCGGPAYRWLKARFPHVHWIRRFVARYIGDHSSMPLLFAHAALTLPLSFYCMAKVAWYIAVKRPLALITDFEAIGMWAALFMRPFSRMRIVQFDNFCAARLAEPPWQPNDWEKKRLREWGRTLRSVVPYADKHLVQSVVHPKLLSLRAEYVHPPIRDVFLQYKGDLRTDGPIVVCLGGTRGFDWLPAVLREAGLPFHVYGFDEAKEDGLVSYRKFEHETYMASLAGAPFVIIRGISSAFDALALKKPVLVCPASGQFEHWYNGRLFETLGVGRLITESLTAESIKTFLADIAPYRQRAEEVSLFDNDATCAAIERAVRR